MKLYKRITAGFLSLLLCCTLLPNTAFAEGSNSYNISGTGVTATDVSSEDAALESIKSEAVYRALGYSMDESLNNPQWGALLSTFKIESQNDIIHFTMDKCKFSG